MNSIDNENVFPFDVDQTLISSRRKHKLPGDMSVQNPYTLDVVYFKPHNAHIDLLKESFGRGRYIIVWSAAGMKWAETIVDALGLREHVHLCLTKPIGYVDDKEAASWMNNRVFLDVGERE